MRAIAVAGRIPAPAFLPWSRVKGISVSEQEPHFRRIRSFVLREGRLTKGQQGALDRNLPAWGLSASEPIRDYADIFGRTAPTVLEIGFGMGQSLVAQASARPDWNFIGIEVHRPGVGACLLSAENAGVDNLRVYNHDAVEVLDKCIPDASLDRIQVFFPDPWPKKRHHKRRLIQPAFTRELAARLKPGGILHLATDWENYAGQMLDVLRGIELLENTSPGGDFVARPELRPKTKFEIRGENLGHGVWDLVFRKSDAP